jgi:hypothetical protein
MWYVDAADVREVCEPELRPVHPPPAPTGSYWFGHGPHSILLIKGYSMFDTEEDALLRLISNLQLERDELTQNIDKLRRRYKKIVKVSLGIQ